MFSLFFMLLDVFKSSDARSVQERSAHEQFLSQATSHAHLEFLEREWDRRAY